MNKNIIGFYNREIRMFSSFNNHVIVRHHMNGYINCLYDFGLINHNEYVDLRKYNSIIIKSIKRHRRKIND